MLKTIATVTTACLLALLFVSSAVAETKKPPGDKGSYERDAYCGDIHINCVVDCATTTWEDDPAWNTCNNQCNSNLASCRSAALGTTYEDVIPPEQSAGVLAEDPLEPDDLFGMSFVNFGRLENACGQVKGKFLQTETSHACVNRACAGPGMVCMIYCANGKCSGGMPDRTDASLTLRGILQNGDNLDRSPAPASSGGGGGSGGASGAGGDDPDEPECGIGGCVQIN